MLHFSDRLHRLSHNRNTAQVMQKEEPLQPIENTPKTRCETQSESGPNTKCIITNMKRIIKTRIAD